MVDADMVWSVWNDVNITADRRTPPRVKSELAAADDLAALVRDGEIDLDDLTDAMAQFLDDDDKWLAANGRSLRWLPRRLSKYLNRDIDAGYGAPPADVLEQIENSANEGDY